MLVLFVAIFILVCEHVLPMLIIRRNPERVLEILLPPFDFVARFLSSADRRAGAADCRGHPARRAEATSVNGAPAEAQDGEAPNAYLETAAEQGLIEGDERRLLQSIVDFGDTLVREVMTPRPDMVAIRADATLDDLRAFFREQEYSRIPVYKENLDNIVGIVFVKDLIRLTDDESGNMRLQQDLGRLVRPATFVPETKRVPEMLKEFQRKQVQIAIVVDEYGGTAGLVTIEDLLEEIVGEIRDEYDVETEPIVDEGHGSFVFSAKVNIDEVRDAARRRDRAGGVRDGRRIRADSRRPRARRRRDVRARRPARRGPRSRAAPHPQGARSASAPSRRAASAARCTSIAECMPRSGYASLIGRPNAGKSTLLNRIIGTKVAIVSDKPQTTRNRILAVKNYDDGQIVFVDTPGIHRPLHRLNVRMVDAAVETLREVDVVALVFDASTRPGHGDEFVTNLLKDLKTPVVLVLNKIDLVAKTRLLPLMEQVQKWREFAAIVPVSAATGDGVERLEQVLLEQMPEGEPGLPGRLPDRSAGAGAGGRDRAREGPPEHPRGAAVLDRGRRRRVRRDRARPDSPSLLHDLRRDGVAEADHHRTCRRHDQAHRHGGPPRPREVLRHEGVSRSAREGQRRLARQRPRPRRHRRAEDGDEATASAGPEEGQAVRFLRQFQNRRGPAKPDATCGFEAGPTSDTIPVSGTFPPPD